MSIPISQFITSLFTFFFFFSFQLSVCCPDLRVRGIWKMVLLNKQPETLMLIHSRSRKTTKESFTPGDEIQRERLKETEKYSTFGITVLFFPPLHLLHLSSPLSFRMTDTQQIIVKTALPPYLEIWGYKLYPLGGFEVS